MRVYIASSWRNQHAVEMLTEQLRQDGHEVASFVEATADTSEEGWITNPDFDFEKWVNSEDGRKKFEYDVGEATGSDLVIYIGPSGTDAWAEVGAAFGAGVPIYGLWAKGEPAGLMRHMMMRWFPDYQELLAALSKLELFKRQGGKEAS